RDRVRLLGIRCDRSRRSRDRLRAMHVATELAAERRNNASHGRQGVLPNSPPKLGGVPFARFSANGGVVPQETTPSAPSKVASQHFLDGAATPPNLGGEFRATATFRQLIHGL